MPISKWVKKLIDRVNGSDGEDGAEVIMDRWPLMLRLARLIRGDDTVLPELTQLIERHEVTLREQKDVVERQKMEEQPEYVTPILDADVPERYRATLAKYRKLATDHGVLVTTAVAYRVKAGFTLKAHVHKAGPISGKYQYMQGFPDDATSDGIVFWIPCVLNGSTSKTRDRQAELLSNLRTSLELPAHHMSGFGNVGLVTGLILAHYKATGERIPLNQYWVRTDTCNAGGIRLRLGCFDSAGLRCDSWSLDSLGIADIGVFALGVEALGN